MKLMEEKVLYIDASNHVLGRLASIIAKKLLEGYTVYVFNCEKAVVRGDRRMVIDSYKLLLNVKTHYNPEKSGIRRPRTPHMLFKRTVRGMLPMDKPKGREAYRRLKVYIGLPKEFTGKQLVSFPEALVKGVTRRIVYLEEIARELGWRGGVPRVA